MISLVELFSSVPEVRNKQLATELTLLYCDCTAYYIVDQCEVGYG